MTFDRLAACAGEWHGSNMLQDPGLGRQPVISESTLSLVALLDGRFVRLDYTWGYHGKPQAGSMLVGCQKKTGVMTVHWIDSWHNGDLVMACEGVVDERAVSVRGSYAAPPGPDWGWRIAIAPDPRGSLSVVMHNISPDGQEELAVEARYSRMDPRR